MPKLEAKTVYQEWEQGWVWPVYWVYGSERLKAREFVKRLKQAALPHLGALGAGMGTETLEGNEVSAGAVVECAQTLSLGGGLRLTLVRDAHSLSDLEVAAQLLGPRLKFEEMPAVTVFLSKDLDQRKKFSKLLTEKAAVVECAEVRDDEREVWIRHLAKRRGLQDLDAEVMAILGSLDPWNLEAIDSEIEKMALALAEDRKDVLIAGASPAGGSEEFLTGLFERDRVRALRAAEQFAGSPEEVLPLLGLLAWNVRQIAGLVGGGAGATGRGPFMERLRRWSRGWTLPEILELQSALHAMDRGLKQTPKLGLGYFTELVGRFAR